MRSETLCHTALEKKKYLLYVIFVSSFSLPKAIVLISNISLLPIILSYVLHKRKIIIVKNYDCLDMLHTFVSYA